MRCWQPTSPACSEPRSWSWSARTRRSPPCARLRILDGNSALGTICNSGSRSGNWTQQLHRGRKSCAFCCPRKCRMVVVIEGRLRGTRIRNSETLYSRRSPVHDSIKRCATSHNSVCGPGGSVVFLRKASEQWGNYTHRFLRSYIHLYWQRAPGFVDCVSGCQRGTCKMFAQGPGHDFLFTEM